MPGTGKWEVEVEDGVEDGRGFAAQNEVEVGGVIKSCVALMGGHLFEPFTAGFFQRNPCKLRLYSVDFWL